MLLNHAESAKARLEHHRTKNYAANGVMIETLQFMGHLSRTTVLGPKGSISQWESCNLCRCRYYINEVCCQAVSFITASHLRVTVLVTQGHAAQELPRAARSFSREQAHTSEV